jgi:hypothetical protein
LQSYLVAYVFWLGIALGCLALAMLHHLVHGRWGLATLRLYEAGAATIPLTAILFLPLAFGVGVLYPWAHGSGPTSIGETGHVTNAFQAHYLNVPGFLARAVSYFLAWSAAAFVMVRWSRQRDAAPSPALDQRLRRMSAGGLVLLGLTVSFAAIDWMMSLEPHWYSTIYGGLVAMGALLSGFAFTIAVLSRIAPRTVLSTVATPAVFNDLGSLLLSFVILWTYLAFSQYLITWSGNTVEEIGWYLRRRSNGWQWLAVLVVAFQFVVPFALLLSKDLKRDARALARVACLLLCSGYVNLLWMIAPAWRAEGHWLRGVNVVLPGVHWLDVAAPIGVGGLWMAWFFYGLGRAPLLPGHDPAWEGLHEANSEERHD